MDSNVQHDADAAVIGLGAFGSMTAWRLAARGASVIGFEQFNLGHDLGSSHGRTRLYRALSVEHEGLIPLGESSVSMIRELEQLSEKTLFEQSGGIMIGPTDGPLISGIRRVTQKHGLDHEVLSSDDVIARFPGHRSVSHGWVGIVDPNAGVLFSDQSVLTACEESVRAGAVLRDRCPVTDIVESETGVTISTTNGKVVVDQVVVCAGAWTARLVPQIPAKVHRVPMLWYQPTSESAHASFQLDRFPVFQRETRQGHRLWGHGGVEGGLPKIGSTGDPTRDRRCHPDRVDRTISPEDWQHVSSQVSLELPDIDPTPAKVITCMTTHSPDGQYVLGRVDSSRIVAAGVGNAHGFKHSAGIGELMADIVLGAEPQFDAAFLSPNRFGT